MKQESRKNEHIISAYLEAVQRSSNWYEAYQLPWWQRLLRHPLLTLRYALTDRFWMTLIALRLHAPFLKARTFWGDTMRVTFPDYRSFYHHGLAEGRELPLQNFLVHFLQEGDVCLDVGANVGIHTLLTAALVGESGKVYAFEPTPRTFDILTANSDNKPNVTRAKMALMEDEGKRNLIDYGVEKSGLNAVLLTSFQDDPQASTLLIDTTTLDEFCRSQGIRPTFIKIDTEGTEEMVLRGGRNTLVTHHPTLVIEVQRDNPRGVVTLLAAFGYQAYQFVENTPVRYADGDALRCPNMLFMYATDEKTISP